MANMEHKCRVKTWDLRFIERDGKSVLQQRFLLEVFGLMPRYEEEWEDVPLVDVAAFGSKREIGRKGDVLEVEPSDTVLAGD